MPLTTSAIRLRLRFAAEPITDSPWLWFALFTAVGLAALLATGGKFGKRQANIENKYQARAAVASGSVQVEESGAGEKTTTGAPSTRRPSDPASPSGRWRSSSA